MKQEGGDVMWLAFLMALVTSAVFFSIPLMVRKRFIVALGGGCVVLGLFTIVYYLNMPSMVWPLFGVISFVGLFLLGVTVAIDFAIEKDDIVSPLIIPLIIWSLVLLVCGVYGGDIFHARQYANMIGDLEKREWTQDIQPKDPRHVRLVPPELAFYLAGKQLGEAQGAIGSQFQLSRDYLTIQKINEELWYVIPFDYKSFSTWTATKGVPGYVMIHAEDPKKPVVVKTRENFVYTPGAYFNYNLVRYLWLKYPTKGFEEYSFEIDDEGNAWWVVTEFRPTISYWGKEVMGVLVINPTTGEDKFYSVGAIPDWVDRVFPANIVHSYILWYGILRDGWWNSFWSHQNLMEPLAPSIVYGSDNQPYWVTDITSVNANDDSLVGLIYTNSRTGKSIYYHASGGTEEAVVDLVNNRVQYKRLHGSGPVLYNIYGVMTSIVPLLGESHSSQGLALVDIANMQLVEADDEATAFSQYAKLISTSGQQVAPEKQHGSEKIEGVVNRFSREPQGNDNTAYYLYLDGVPHVFVGNGELSPKIRITEPGDSVILWFIDSGEDTLQLTKFDNASIKLAPSKLQTDLRLKTEERREEEEKEREKKNIRGEVQNLSDEELKELLEIKKNAK